MTKAKMNKEELMKEYRSILSMIADTGNSTKAATLRMRMEADGANKELIDEVVEELIKEQETASELQ